MSTQTRDLITFFQKAFQAGTVERDPEKYLAKYGSEIEAAGQVFQYLELAKPDSKAALGWKPTRPLLDLIAKSNVGPSKTKPKSFEPVFLSLMLDTMLGSDRGEGVTCFCLHCLVRLGLVVQDSDDYMVTDELLELFSRPYYVRMWGAHDPNATYEMVLEGPQ
jgi:hypothetical protein